MVFYMTAKQMQFSLIKFNEHEVSTYCAPENVLVIENT